MDTNAIVNTIYHGVVVTVISMGYAMIGKKLLKMKSPDFDRLSIEDAGKLTGLIGSSLATQNWLVTQGILPDKIVNPKP